MQQGRRTLAEADPALDRPNGPALKVKTGKNPKKIGIGRRKLLMAIVPLTLIVASGGYWYLHRNSVSTDNAYVRQDIVSVSSDITGRIIEVAVRENQQVQAGDLLFRIDQEPYRVALEQADAEIASAQVNVGELRSKYQSTDVDMIKARNDIEFAQSEYGRQRQLFEKGFTTKARLDVAQHALDVAYASLREAEAGAVEARSALASGSQVPGMNPQLAVARAARDKALLNLQRTEIRAPVAGRISQTNRLQVGQMLVTGLPAVSIVANDASWVEANFKETQLNRIRPGQSATISLDAYSGLELRGHVASIGGGTGSQFSVLPAQNATGNWIKVTQRVPVRIAIDEKSPRPLITGLSSEVTVDVGR